MKINKHEGIFVLLAYSSYTQYYLYLELNFPISILVSYASYEFWKPSLLKSALHLSPAPTRYVLVPCRVKEPGLQPRILITRGESCSTFGMFTRFPAYPEYVDIALFQTFVQTFPITKYVRRVRCAYCFVSSTADKSILRIHSERLRIQSGTTIVYFREWLPWNRVPIHETPADKPQQEQHGKPGTRKARQTKIAWDHGRKWNRTKWWALQRPVRPTFQLWKFWVRNNGVTVLAVCSSLQRKQSGLISCPSRSQFRLDSWRKGVLLCFCGLTDSDFWLADTPAADHQ